MSATTESIARDLLDYLREHPDVCAEGNVHGWRWLRFVDGEWRAAKYGGKHRLKRFVDGEILDEEAARAWLESKPVTLIPATEAYLWGPSEATVWEDADEQDAFTDSDRCFWCGSSERSVALDRFETAEDGECLLCPECEESWERAGEIVATAGGA